MIAVKNISALRALVNHEEGEVAFVEEENKKYCYQTDDWYPMEIEPEGEGIKMSLYDLNKQIIGQQPAFNDEQIAEAKATLRNFIDGLHNRYYMLLCKELSYYTVFRFDALEPEKMEDAVLDCMSYLGEIKGVYPDDSGDAIALWATQDDNTFAAFFFPYDGGVITCQ